MDLESRPAEIGRVGEIAGGTHSSLFYETEQDLIEILGVYFQAGLANHEFCLWLTSDPNVDKARSMLRQALPSADRFLESGDIEIRSFQQWYLEDGVFEPIRVLDNFDTKLTRSLAKGYPKMRVLGDDAWLDREHWQSFSDFEGRLEERFAGKPISILCAYPAGAHNVADILEVARTHRFVVSKRNGVWEIFESPRLKQAEAALQRAEKLFRAIVEDQSEMIVRWKPDGTRTFVNEAYCRTFGKTFDELVGTSFWPLVAEPYQTSELERIRRLTPDSPYSMAVHESILPDGSTQWQEWSDRGFFDAQGRLVELQSVGRDITERKRAEESLRESEAKLKQAQQIARIGYWERDLIADRITWSEETGRIFGLESYGGGQSLAQFLDLVHPDDLARFQQALHEALQGSRLFDIEVREVRPDGELRFLHIRDEIVYDETGKPSRMFGTVQDITDRKQVEAERERLFDELKQNRAQLQTLSRRLVEVQESERKNLARELHDEIGQTLSGLMLQVGTAKGLLPKSAISALNILEQSETLVDEALDRTRAIIAGLRPQVLDDLGLAPALRGLGEELHEDTGALVEVTTLDLPKRLPPPFEVALFRIAQEALTNVRKHAQAGGVSITLAREDERVVLSVEDDGLGFEQETTRSGLKDEIFIEGGWPIPTGHFGLIGIRERVKQLGGRLQITSAPGEGTTLLVELPFSEAEAPTDERL